MATTARPDDAGTYDAPDRLTAYGAVTYTYTANVDLRTATSGGGTTTHRNAVFGNLVGVSNGVQHFSHLAVAGRDGDERDLPN